MRDRVAPETIHAMLRLIGLMISIGFADSLNPSTIAPAMYLATVERNAARHVMRFTLGVFAVYLLGGLAIALGPGQLVLALAPHPHPGLKYVLEIVAGAVLLTISGVLWTFRDLLAERELPTPRIGGRSSAVLGATITAVELPTAFPYFAAIAAVVGSDFGIDRQVILLVIFNLTFVLPLLAIVVILRFAGRRAQSILVAARLWMERRWPLVLAAIGVVAGLFCLFIGISGLIILHQHHASDLNHLRHLLTQ